MSSSGPVEVQRGDSRLVGQLDSGALQGLARVSEQGRPQAAMSYHQGALQGPMVLYHPDGKPSAKLTFKQDRLHGPASNYFEDGSLASREHYQNGQLQGRCQRYHSNGCLAETIDYHQGQPLEASRRYAADGRPLNAQGQPMARWRWWWLSWSQPPE